MLPKLRTLNRLRWIQKARIVASHGEAPLRHLRYVLVDYLFEAFCYPVENQEDLARWLAGAFSREQSEVRALLSELEGDVALQELLRSRLRLPGDRRPVDFGYRLPWYLIARLAKPRLIVETGIQSGLGSI